MPSWKIEKEMDYKIKMDLKEVVHEDHRWVIFAQDRVQLWALAVEMLHLHVAD